MDFKTIKKYIEKKKSQRKHTIIHYNLSSTPFAYTKERERLDKHINLPKVFYSMFCFFIWQCNETQDSDKLWLP